MSESDKSSLSFGEGEVQKIFQKHLSEPTPPNPDLPSRRAILTYLKHLDKQWRGGWSWQWPLVIAGPPNGGKTQFLYQLIASSLLSCHSFWRIFYCDLAGDYSPEQIQKILEHRTNDKRAQRQLGRVDKITLLSRFTLLKLFQWNWQRTDLALWVMDGWEHIGASVPLTMGLELLAEFSQRKQVGMIVTIRGTVKEISPQIPWSVVPYFLHIFPKEYGFHRLRIWLNGLQNKIYDRTLRFTASRGYFCEVHG